MTRTVVLLAGAVLWLTACSGFTEYLECLDGETSPCETVCGPGTMTCVGDSWGECYQDEMPACMPGESGTCELTPGQPPGLWLCSDTCQVGPCINFCLPGDTFECDAGCGRGQATCLDDGTWSECIEYIIPDCGPGDVQLCRGDDGVGYQRCTDECVYGPCEVSMTCFPGEVVECATCAAQECSDDGIWEECLPHPGRMCAPGESQDCIGPCGEGFQTCNDLCEWTECSSLGMCTPGQRQVCPAGYCGIAYRICGPNCVWTPCIEVGD